MKMKLKRPFEFDITPDTLRTGKQWVTVHLKNVSDEKLSQLDIKLYSRVPGFIDVMGTGKFTSEMNPGDTRVFPFQVHAELSTRLYATISGDRDGTYFFWTSPDIEIDVGTTKAKLRNVFALTHPYAVKDKTIEAEAVVEGVTGGRGLKVIFWHDSPSSYERLGEVRLDKIDVAEVKRASIEFTPEENGIHVINGYLYDDGRFIGTESDTIWIE